MLAQEDAEGAGHIDSYREEDEIDSVLSGLDYPRLT